MVYSDCCREKLSCLKIKGQTKPFIDQNLQLQLPGFDGQPHHSQTLHSPIYTHYVVPQEQSDYFSEQINETELYHAMAHADNSYSAWKKMQKYLDDRVQSYKKTQ